MSGEKLSECHIQRDEGKLKQCSDLCPDKPYQLLKVRNSINHDLQDEYDIYLSTPQ